MRQTAADTCCILQPFGRTKPVKSENVYLRLFEVRTSTRWVDKPECRDLAGGQRRRMTLQVKLRIHHLS